MATWMGHLRIAEKMLALIPGLNAVEFVCGNLAPDSGQPNADGTAFDPPAEITHFLEQGQIHDLEFYRRYLKPVPPHDSRYSFLLGYFFHLVCDNLWNIRIGNPSRYYYADLFDHQEDATWHVKSDWYGLDFVYVRDQPESFFWKDFLNFPNPASCLPFLPESALHQRLNHIRQFYSQSTEKMTLNRSYVYLNETTMNRFIEESTVILLQVHQVVQLGENVNSQLMVLPLLPNFQPTGYKPLGNWENLPVRLCPDDPTM